MTEFPWWLSGKEFICQCRRHKFYPWVGKIFWNRRWHPLQYSCLENSMDRGGWQATVHGVTKSWMWLSTKTHSYTHIQNTGKIWGKARKIDGSLYNEQLWKLCSSSLFLSSGTIIGIYGQGSDIITFILQED